MNNSGLIINLEENNLPIIIFTPKFDEFSIEELLKRIDVKAGLEDSENSIYQFFSKISSEKNIELGEPVFPYDVEAVASKLFSYGLVYKIERQMYDAFYEMASHAGIQLHPGDALIIFPTQDSNNRVQLFEYEATEGKSAELVENNNEILEIVKSYSKYHEISYHHILFLEDLNELHRKHRIEELKQKSKDSEYYLDEFYRLEDINRDLKDENKRLRQQVYGLNIALCNSPQAEEINLKSSTPQTEVEKKAYIQAYIDEHWPTDDSAESAQKFFEILNEYAKYKGWKGELKHEFHITQKFLGEIAGDKVKSSGNKQEFITREFLIEHFLRRMKCDRSVFNTDASEYYEDADISVGSSRNVSKVYSAGIIQGEYCLKQDRDKTVEKVTIKKGIGHSRLARAERMWYFLYETDSKTIRVVYHYEPDHDKQPATTPLSNIGVIYEPQNPFVDIG